MNWQCVQGVTHTPKIYWYQLQSSVNKIDKENDWDVTGYNVIIFLFQSYSIIQNEHDLFFHITTALDLDFFKVLKVQKKVTVIRVTVHAT